jgi:Tfp pilus assembly protein PilO
MVIAPKRSDANKLQSEITTAQSQLAQAQAQVASGETAKKSYRSLYTSLARLGEAVPTDDDVPSLIYQLQSAANTTKVDFQDFVLTPGTGGSATPPPAATGATGATGIAGAAGAATGALAPGVEYGVAGIPIEPFTLTFNGNYFHLADFIRRIEHFVDSKNNQIVVRGRLMTLNAISIGPASQGFPEVAVSISATTYIDPATPSIAAPTTSNTSSVSNSNPAATGSSGGSEFPTASIAP